MATVEVFRGVCGCGAELQGTNSPQTMHRQELPQCSSCLKFVIVGPGLILDILGPVDRDQRPFKIGFGTNAKFTARRGVSASPNGTFSDSNTFTWTFQDSPHHALHRSGHQVGS
jgi:hypothetical protein